MSAGDVLHLRTGTHAGGFNVTLNNLTIQSWAAERAVVASPTGNPSITSAVLISAQGVTLRNLDIQGGYDQAVSISGDSARLIRCRIEGGGRDCVQLSPGADGAIIEQCEISDSGARDSSGADGIDGVNCDNLAVRDCYVHDVAAAGICARAGAIGAVIERCLVVNAGTGVLLGGASATGDLDLGQNPGYRENIDGVVRNCIITACSGPGVELQAALNARVQNNTLVNVAGALSSGLRMSGTVHASASRMCEDVEFSNNIVTASAGSGITIVRITATGLTGSLTMRNNRYRDAVGAATYADDRVPANYLLAQWQAALGVDAGSSEGDPGLSATHHLAGGSACIGTGFTLAAFSDDYDGNTRAGAWDIGADQTGGTALPVPPGSSIFGTGGGTPEIPAAPSGLILTVVPDQYIVVNWTDNSTIETGFRIERKVGTGSFVTLGVLEGNRVSTFDSGVADGIQYTYRVFALGTSGSSGPSNEETATMIGTPNPPPSGGGGGGGDGGGGGCVAHTAAATPLIMLIPALLRRRRRAMRLLTTAKSC